MIPARLFRSRWSALLWSAGILWTAYDVAMTSGGSAPANTAAPARDATGEAIDANDLAILANAGS